MGSLEKIWYPPVAHALLRAATALLPSQGIREKAGRSHERESTLRAVSSATNHEGRLSVESVTCVVVSGKCERRTQECVRHGNRNSSGNSNSYSNCYRYSYA